CEHQLFAAHLVLQGACETLQRLDDGQLAVLEEVDQEPLGFRVPESAILSLASLPSRRELDGGEIDAGVAPRLAQRFTGAILLEQPSTKAVAKRRLEVRQARRPGLVVHPFSGGLTTDVIAENVTSKVLLEVADTQAERRFGVGAPLRRSHRYHLAPAV